MRIVFLLVLFSSALFGQDKPVFLYEQDDSLLTTNVHIVIRAGLLQDPRGKEGVANLLSDLAVRGTQEKSRSEFQSELEGMGGALSGWAGSSNVSFYGSVIRENTDRFLELIKEVILKPSFNETEFRKLKREVAARISYSKNSSSSLGRLALKKALYKGTPLAYSVRGSLRTLAAIRLSDLKSFYKTHFHQGNLLIAVSSSEKESAIRSKFEAIWKELPKGIREPLVKIEPSVPESPKLYVVNKKGVGSTNVLFAQKGISAADPIRHTIRLGNYAFGGEPFVSRLFKHIRAEKGWTYSVGSAYQSGIPKQKGSFLVYASPSSEYTANLIYEVFDMWADYLKKGINEEELALSKEGSINSYPFSFDTPSKRLSLKVSSEIQGINVLEPKAFAKRLNRVTNEEIVKALSDLHTEKGWAVTLVGDVNRIRKQLKKAQKAKPGRPALGITKVWSPDQLIR